MSRGCRLAISLGTFMAVAAVAGRSARAQEVRSLDRALVFLARQQRSDGAFGQGVGRARLTARVTVAFLAAGQPPGPGRFGLVVSRAQDFLIAHAEREDPDADVVLALSQLSGVPADAAHQARMRAVLARQVGLLAASQLSTGAFPAGAGESAVSGTCRAVLALRGAAKAGFGPPANALPDAVRYLASAVPADLDESSRLALTLTLSGVPIVEQEGLLDPLVAAGKLSPIAAADVALLSQCVPPALRVVAPPPPSQNSDGSLGPAQASSDAVRAEVTALGVLELTATSRLLPAFRL
jgi:hypothetical protein